MHGHMVSTQLVQHMEALNVYVICGKPQHQSTQSTSLNHQSIILSVGEIIMIITEICGN